MKKKPYVIIILVLAIIILGSIGLNVMQYQKSKKIYSKLQNYSDVGLEAFLTDDITDMYVACEWNPYYEGYFNDSEILKQTREIIKYGEFVQIRDSDTPSSNKFYDYIKFYTKDGYVAFAVGGGFIRVTIDNEYQWYFSNTASEIHSIIDIVIEKYSEDLEKQW